MKYQLIIYLYISLFPKYKLDQIVITKDNIEEAYKEYCNIQIPVNKSICNDLELHAKNESNKTMTFINPIPSKACCFERFRLNKIIATRCVYIDKTEDGIKEEKKTLKEEWGVKDLTILCSGGNLKFKFLFFLILELLLFIF